MNYSISDIKFEGLSRIPTYGGHDHIATYTVSIRDDDDETDAYNVVCRLEGMGSGSPELRVREVVSMSAHTTLGLTVQDVKDILDYNDFGY